MKLKRFESDELNENRMYFTSDKKEVSEDTQKFEIIERLAQHWNEKLKNDYLVPRSLYNYSLNELKEIEKFYIGESSEYNDVLSFINKQINIDKKEYKGDIPTKYNTGSPWNDSGWLIAEIIQFLEKGSSYVLNKFEDKYSYEELDNILKTNYKAEYEKAKSLLNESCDITDKTCTICETLAELKELHMSNEAVQDIYAEDGEIVFDCKCETDIQGTTEYNGITLRYNKLCEIPLNESVSFEDDEMTEEEIIEHARMIKESCINEYLNEIKKSL